MRPVNLKFSKPRDFRFLLKKQGNLAKKHGDPRILSNQDKKVELCIIISIISSWLNLETTYQIKVMLGKQLMTKNIIGNFDKMVFLEFFY